MKQAIRGLHAQVANELGGRIVRGKFLPGTTLPNENDLGQEFGVSRTVIREAIKSLTAKGLVSSLPKTGTIVRPRTSWSMLDADVLGWNQQAAPDAAFLADMMEVRRILEPEAAAVATSRATREERAELKRAYDRLHALATDEENFSSQAVIAADMDLHAAIFAATHNELLQHLIRTIGQAFMVNRTLTVSTPEDAQSSLGVHQAVVDAICSRDAGRARQAMQDLIATAERDLKRALKKRHEPGRVRR